MILQKLVELARREGLVDDPDFEPKAVGYLIRVARDGRFVGIQSTFMTARGAKGKPVAKSFSVPVQCKRTSGILPYLLCDKGIYVLGVETGKGKDDRREDPTRFAHAVAASAALVRELATATNDDGARAVATFLDSPAQREIAVAELARQERRAEDPSDADGLTRVQPGALFTFLLDDDVDVPVFDRPRVRAWWKERRASKRTDAISDARCVVTGDPADVLDPHPAIKLVPGGKSECALVSFGGSASVVWESYGWSKFENARVSQAAADAYARALNRLLDPRYPDPRHDGQVLPSRRVDLAADTAVLFWASDPDPLEDLFGDVLAATPEAVKALFSAPYSGREATLDRPRAFYALTLSGSSARVVIRDWFESTVETVAGNVQAYFDDIHIARRNDGPLPLRRLLESTAVQGKRDNILPGLAADVFKAIVRGRAFPRQLLDAVLLRVRAERDVTPERAALLKAWLNRARRANAHLDDYPEVKVTIDETNTTMPYRLGRAFAVLEKLQIEAIKPKRTIRDQFYGAASATPAVVMPTLIRKSIAHIAKLDARGRYLDTLLGTILAPVDRFPTTMEIVDQGLFALGYYHQREELYTKRAQPGAPNQTPETPNGAAS